MSYGYNSDQIDKLSEPQKQCLRLVADLLSSKQIARVLDISHHTVDQRLKRAQTILGVSSRAEAARMLIGHESGAVDSNSETYGNLVYQNSGLPQYRYARNEGASTGERSPSVDSGETELREDQAFIFDRPLQSLKRSTLFSALFEVDRENHLSIGARAAIMLLIVVTGLVSFALLVNLAEGFSRLV